jgi:hypothetical protein
MTTEYTDLIDHVALVALRYADERKDQRLRRLIADAASVASVSLMIYDPLTKAPQEHLVPVLAVEGNFSLHVNRYAEYAVTHLPSGLVLQRKDNPLTHTIDTALQLLWGIKDLDASDEIMSTEVRKAITEVIYAL